VIVLVGSLVLAVFVWLLLWKATGIAFDWGRIPMPHLRGRDRSPSARRG
jgi:hypothetical protein